MIDNWPFSAPAWPPDTGASRKWQSRLATRSAISRARLADVVVWSMRIVPRPRLSSMPSTTSRTSASAPTHKAMTCAPLAASASDAAARA